MLAEELKLFTFQLVVMCVGVKTGMKEIDLFIFELLKMSAKELRTSDYYELNGGDEDHFHISIRL